MTDDQTETLALVFRAVLDLADGADVSDLRPITLRKWDSLAQVSLVAAIESEFGIRCDAADAERMTSFEATRLLLEEKLR